ncbi:MAG: alpha/beta fold hydrolase [Candidatus Omnitrophica bacterium]|nr:alpha/beta fold hydrolase [Candidatus Omnitrophota bacterium]
MPVKFHLDFWDNNVPEADTSVLHPNNIYLEGTSGAAIILIHGLTGTPNEMHFLANSLNKAGYTVLCPRLAKHGGPLKVLKYAKWQEFYRSVRDAFMQVRDTHRIVFAAGLSMGALLALLLADEFKEEIAGVSCLSPTLFYDGWNTPWTKYLLPLGYFTPLKYVFYFKEAPPYGIKNQKIQEMVDRHYSKAKINDIQGALKYGYPYFPLTLFCQLRLLVKYLSKKIGGIEVPVQLIQAEDDDMTSIKNSQFIYDRIKSEKKEIVLLHNSYHVITADQERAVVAKKMHDFFDIILADTKTIASRSVL